MNYYITNTNSINNVLNSVIDGDIIYLEEGIFFEKITVKQNNITIIGKGQDKTTIIFNDHYHKIINNDSECNTFRTYTMEITGNNVTIKDLKIENNCVPSSIYGQAVALNVLGDNFLAENVCLSGAQDTLFTGPFPNDLKKRYENFISFDALNKIKSRQKYLNCKIIGDVDFIFGGGTCLFDRCEIHSIGQGYISAPSHDISTKYGFLFNKCIFSCDDPTKKVYLARPWRDYGAAAFIDSIYDNHIYVQGFFNWQNTNRDKTCRFYESFSEDYSKKRATFAIILDEKQSKQYLLDFLMELNKN